MFGLVPFALLFAIAAVGWFVMNRYGTPRMRALLDRTANARSGMPGTGVIARVGENTAPRESLGRVTRPLTIGVKAISVIAFFALLYVLNIWRDSPQSILPSEYFWQGYIVSSLLLAWYMGYVMTYELEQEGHELIVPTWTFGRRSYDLRELIRIEDDGQYLLRLYFEDGGKAEVMKHVAGRAEFVTDLEGYLPG